MSADVEVGQRRRWRYGGDLIEITGIVTDGEFAGEFDYRYTDGRRGIQTAESLAESTELVDEPAGDTITADRAHVTVVVEQILERRGIYPDPDQVRHDVDAILDLFRGRPARVQVAAGWPV